VNELSCFDFFSFRNFIRYVVVFNKSVRKYIDTGNVPKENAHYQIPGDIICMVNIYLI